MRESDKAFARLASRVSAALREACASASSLFHKASACASACGGSGPLRVAQSNGHRSDFIEVVRSPTCSDTVRSGLPTVPTISEAPNSIGPRPAVRAVCTRPPTRPRPSRIITLCPAAVSERAAARPARPAPITTTVARLPTLGVAAATASPPPAPPPPASAAAALPRGAGARAPQLTRDRRSRQTRTRGASVAQRTRISPRAATRATTVAGARRSVRLRCQRASTRLRSASVRSP
mmetsp:Transcript_42920/g.105846  ORF Transcript_42920/g.105846 Transcript_42920/m.105846 type:complete len:236 (+) Transcript_42920:252-959(+)